MPTYIRVKDLPNSATSLNTDDFIMLSGSTGGARKIQKADFLSTVAGSFNAAPSTYKLATLDASNKVDASQWPASAFSYQGTWAASSNTPTLANGSGTAGYTYYASDSGSVNFGAGAISFTAGDAVVYDGSIWQKVPDVANILDGKATVDEGKTTLQIPNVGSAANEVSVNGMLGDLAFQSSEGPSVGALEAESATIKSNSGVTTTQALAVTNGTATRLAVLEDGRVGVGTESVTTGFNLEVVSGDMRVADAAGADACELGYSAGAGKSFVQSYNRNTSTFSDLVLNNVATVTANGRLIIANIPTSASGLASGTVWSDSGTLKIVS